jgi:hypothetical protein
VILMIITGHNLSGIITLASRCGHDETR